MILGKKTERTAGDRGGPFSVFFKAVINVMTQMFLEIVIRFL